MKLKNMSFDRIADKYDETRIIPKSVLSRFYMEIMANGIKLDPDSFVLDAGVGTGRTVEPLLELGVQLVGIDISRKMLKRMIEKLSENSASNQVSLILCDVTMLPFRAHSFNFVISVHVLHLVKKWRKAIQESKRVLKPESFFIAATHGAPDLVSKIGQKYFELCNKNDIPQAKGLRGNLTRILNSVFKYEKMRFLEHISKTILERNSFLGRGGENYLRRQAVSTRRFIIRWKQNIDVNEIFNRLNERIISKQWRISTKIHEKIMCELGKWKNEEIRRNGPLEKISREFKVITVHFK